MKSMRSICLLLSVLFLVGCEIRPFDTYMIEGEKTFTARVPESSEKLCSILSEVAKEHHLVKQKPVRKSTICYFNNEINGFYLLVGARRLDGNVVVDITSWNRSDEHEVLTKSVIRALKATYSDFDPNPVPYVRK